MDRRKFLAATGMGAMAALLARLSLADPTLATAPKRPNFVVVLADDLGYAALSCNGGKIVETPKLDGLASEGMRFTNCHVEPLCTPTRVAVMTGRGNRRNYIGFGELDPNEITFAHVLKVAGYATAVSGKWQLGNMVTGPRQAGFDNANIHHAIGRKRERWSRYWGGLLTVDGVEQELDDDVFAADAQLAWSLDWIDAHRDGPFLMYMPTPLTHDTYANGPNEYTAGKPVRGIEKFTGRKALPSLLGHLDRQMGVLTDHLRSRGLDRDTLFLFLGDNGMTVPIARVDGATVPRAKDKTTNAGTHSPCIAWWPGRIKPGVAVDLVADTDVLPTLADLGGAAAPKDRALDGVSLAPRLLRGQPSPRTEIYHWYSPHGEEPIIWVHDARWKLYADGRLYDTVADGNEQHPIAPADAPTDVRRRLQAVIDRHAAIPEPHIRGGGQRGGEN